MAKLLCGRQVADALAGALRQRADALRESGVIPTLGILRVGENPGDLSYEKGAEKRAEKLGVAVKKVTLSADAGKDDVLAAIDRLNADASVHGVLMLRPLPAHLKSAQAEICDRLRPEKDMDGMTSISGAGVFAGNASLGFAPCTPEACMEILKFYGIDCTGKNAVVIGRSAVVGKPAAMMLLRANATVTVCHTRTVGLAEICRRADILLSCAGVCDLLNTDFVREGQTVIDVSVNYNERKTNADGTLGALSGDASFDEIEPIVAAITPVPGGVGAVTTTVLMRHVIEAAERAR